MKKIDINCDIGEGYGIYNFGRDEELISLITSANIACGFHAGDFNQMFKAVEGCLKHDVAIGAHPGYPDLQGFGRRTMNFNYTDIKNMIVYQVGALMAVAGSMGAKVEHVKPHGALYNEAAKNNEVAEAVIDAVVALNGPALVALAGSKLVDLAKKKGLLVIQEGFADRNYDSNGALLSRHLGDAVIFDPLAAANRVVKMVNENKVTSYDGKEINIYVDTVCVHGDNKNAVNILKEIHSALLKNGIQKAKPNISGGKYGFVSNN